MIKPKCEWSFTDPDVDLPRICRELEAAGACVGLVTRSDGAITLANVAETWPSDRMVNCIANFRASDDPALEDWFCFRGDCVVEALGVRKVTVKGYSK